ncbi:MAG: glutathione S-transferase family protein [Myxococcales bacterium]|nr:glutathione S-transferase family protein [Myxococcales bacterium]
MGHLDGGTWHVQQGFPTDASGAFTRAPTTFRGTVEPAAAAEAGRHHLYVALACPWAHRTLVARALLGLEQAISVSVVHPYMGEQGWTFAPADGVVPDPIHGATYLWEIYRAADPKFTGRVTVPVLWDRVANTIVNNESREILRMMSTRFASLGHGRLDLAPIELRPSIEAALDAMYGTVNNGVYRAGFARTQGAYDRAVTELFAALDGWETRLGTNRFLCGDVVTEADICLYTTLFRFDAVYHGHFKCNLRRIVDYPNLWGFLRDVYQLPGVAAVSNVEHCKQHYYRSHAHINPTGIVPAGPIQDLSSPHHRGPPLALG